MKRIYNQPTAVVITFGDNLMRSQMANWSLGEAGSTSEAWKTEEIHPIDEKQDWTGRLNTGSDAWGTDIWGESE